MTTWLVGAGIVGRRVERMLGSVVVHDVRRDPLPLVEPGDVVVLAHPVDHAPLARHLGLRGASVVSVGDDLDDTRELLELGPLFADAGATVVVGAAMSTGLTGLLARYLGDQMATVDEIHVATHGTAGPACARDHHRSLSRRSSSWHDGEWVEHVGGSGRELCWFPEPVGAMDCYRAELSAPYLLQRAYPDASRISARRSATRRDRFTARLPMLRPPHAEGGVGAIRVEVRGAAADGSRQCLIVGVAELVGTAAAAAAAAFAIMAADGRLRTGEVTAIDESAPTSELLGLVESFGVRLQEFTGVPQPA